MGILAKRADGIPVIGEIGTELGIWVLVATVLAVWSPSPKVAALRVFAFFAAMLVTYYTYSMVLFGFFPTYYFLMWGWVACLSPIAAYVVWHARGNGWVAALCASLPVAVLLAEGYSFYYTFRVPQGFALLSALLLFAILPVKKPQRLRMIPWVAVVLMLFAQLHLTSTLIGGW